MSILDLQSILVPLDGSVLAESTLPATRFLAHTTGAQVILLHVVEKNPPRQVHGQDHLSTAEAAQAYLSRLAQSLPQKPAPIIRVEQARTKRVAREIARQQAETNAGLTLLCTHGHSGLGHLVSGSIAQRVVGLSRRALLLIHPQFAQFEPQRILIPIDGDPAHEHSLDAGVDLAVRLGLSVDLLVVIPTVGTTSRQLSVAQRTLPFMTHGLLEMQEEEEAQGYLKAKRQQVCDCIEQRKPNACFDCDFSIARGDPVETILTNVSRNPGTLLVLATHGRFGIQAFWEGSVANQLGLRMKQPMLLIPVED